MRTLDVQVRDDKGRLLDTAKVKMPDRDDDCDELVLMVAKAESRIIRGQVARMNIAPVKE